MIKLLENKQVKIGLAIILGLILITLFAPLVTKYDYSQINLKDQLLPPGTKGYFLGTDAFGRDLWTRLVYGGRVSLVVSLVSAIFAGIAGTILGITCGYFGGTFDMVVGRIMDIMMAFPTLLLSMLMGAALQPTIKNMGLIIGIPLIPSFYRVIRSKAMSLCERGFVKAALSMGASNAYIIRRHIFPNILSQFFIMFSFALGSSIMAESALGFLGLGVPIPTPSWGLIVNEGKNFVFSSPWLIIFSSVLISLTIFGFNMLGDGIRDCLDPKLER